MSIVSKLKISGAWQLLQVASQVFMQFTYMAVMARLLHKSDFGLMALAVAFIGFGILFTEAGMGAALIQRQNITQRHMNAALQISLLIGVLIFIIFFISAGAIALFFNQPLLEPIIRIIGVIIILSSLGNVSRSLLQKNFNFKHTSLVMIFSTVVGYSVGIIFAYQDYGVWSLIIATLISTLISTIIMLYLAPVKFSLKFYFKEWKELFTFGSGIIIAGLINKGSSQGLILVLGKFFTPVNLGLFERAFTIKSMPSTYLGGILDTIMFPAMAEIQDENERLFRVYQHGLGIVNTLLIPVALFLIFFAKEIVLILLGKAWLDAVIPLQIMFLVLPFSSSIRMADSVIRAKGLIYKNVIRRSIFLAVLLITSVIGAYNYHIIGAAIAVSFSYLFNYCIMLFLVQRIFYKSFSEIFLQPLLAGLKVSILTLLLVILPTALLDNWNHDSIAKFLVSGTFVGSCWLWLLWKRPEIFGIYVAETLKQLVSKRKKKLKFDH